MRLTSHHFSPSVLGKIIRSSVREPSFQGAADALEDLAELTMSSRQISRIAQEVGQQLQAGRDQDVKQLAAHELKPRVETRPALAVVGVDGGRLQIRGQGDGPGAHNGSWREDKISVLATAAVTAFDSDPEPDLPECFRDRKYVEELVRGISGQSSLRPTDLPAEAGVDPPPEAGAQPGEPRKKPALLVRTFVASTCGSDHFGPMVAAEAQKRNFTNAALRAFLGDGAAWIWKLHQRYFPTFVAIIDFLHVLGHLFAAAKAAKTEAGERWSLFQAWAEACWQGQVGRVIEQLVALRGDLEPLPEDGVEGLDDDDPRKIIARELGYLEHNQERMDYPRYRQAGLPWTSSHMESTVKLFNQRVKGSEKFWGDHGAEAILQLRAAFLSEDDRLGRHLKSRASNPFRKYKARQDAQAA